MICPVEIAREVSALRAARVGDDAQHDLLRAGRDGAGNESTGSDFASHGEKNYVVAGGRDYRHQRPLHAALARSATKSLATTGCSTGGGESRLPNGCRWPPWSGC